VATSEDLENGRTEERSWRRIFEEEFHPLEVDQRLLLARQASGENLRAFCFDPSPKVITAVFENPNTGLDHARLVAEHHRSGIGLDQIGKRSEFLRDRQVQRLLYRNPQLSVRLVNRIFQMKRMGDVYRLAMSREATDRVRSTAKKEFRKKFTSGSAEERVSLIIKGEGRCLVFLVGIALDGKAASMLCQRPLVSTLLIQNLARWPSTPPTVLQHMARQPMVMRSPALKNLVLRHPNTPSRLKAQG